MKYLISKIAVLSSALIACSVYAGCSVSVDASCRAKVQIMAYCKQFGAFYLMPVEGVGEGCTEIKFDGGITYVTKNAVPGCQYNIYYNENPKNPTSATVMGATPVLEGGKKYILKFSGDDIYGNNCESKGFTKEDL